MASARRVAASAAVKPAMPAPFGQQVRDADHRTLHVRERLAAAVDEKDRQQARVEAAGPDDDGVERADRLGDARVNRTPAGRATAGRSRRPPACPASTSTSPRVVEPSAYSAQSVARSTVIGHTCPRQPSSARNPSTAARKSPRVLLHHREQQVAAGVAGQPAVLEHRQAREQDLAGLALVARERQRALEHVARRQHAQLVAQLPGRAAAVEHRDDRVQIDPRIVLESAEQTRQPGAAAKAPDLQDAQTHGDILPGRARPPRRRARLDRMAVRMRPLELSTARGARSTRSRRISGASSAIGSSRWSRTARPPAWRSSRRLAPTISTRAPRSSSRGTATAWSRRSS